MLSWFTDFFYFVVGLISDFYSLPFLVDSDGDVVVPFFPLCISFLILQSVLLFVKGRFGVRSD